MKYHYEVFERNHEWEQTFGFDPKVNYLAVVQEYNEHIAKRNKEASTLILREHGGLISLTAKACYQRDINNGYIIVREP